MRIALSFLLTRVLLIETHSLPRLPYGNDLSTTLIENLDEEAGISHGSDSSGSASFAHGIVNTNILTLFNYNGSQKSKVTVSLLMKVIRL